MLKRILIPTIALIAAAFVIINNTPAQTNDIVSQTKMLPNVKNVQYEHKEHDADKIYLEVTPEFQIEQFNTFTCNQKIIKTDEKPTRLIFTISTAEKSITADSIPIGCEKDTSNQQTLNKMWELANKPQTQIKTITVSDKIIMEDYRCEENQNTKENYQANIAFLTNLTEDIRFLTPMIKEYNGCNLINIEKPTDEPQQPNSYEEMTTILKILDKNNIYTDITMHGILVKINNKERIIIPETVTQELETALPHLAFKTYQPTNL